jgi:hypothetical protein
MIADTYMTRQNPSHRGFFAFWGIDWAPVGQNQLRRINPEHGVGPQWGENFSNRPADDRHELCRDDGLERPDDRPAADGLGTSWASWSSKIGGHQCSCRPR